MVDQKQCQQPIGWEEECQIIYTFTEISEVLGIIWFSESKGFSSIILYPEIYLWI